ncbi:hypothetical protein [Klebsiella variicola]|uniref:hypothetical protein n=1 Tax=Klebsiella variicola TaxID=244366 RepID=UPI0034DFD4E6
MWESIMGLFSNYSLDISGAWSDMMEGSGKGGIMSSCMGGAVMGVMSGVTRGLLGGGATPKAHAQSTAYHFQTNANPVNALQTGFNDMKLQKDDVLNGFNSLKNLF